jgi:hypothetical protein
MTIINVLSLGVALAALGISIASFVWTKSFNDRSFRRQFEKEHISLLLELDRFLIIYPELWGIYDHHAHLTNRKRTSDALETARREAFIFATINIFELVHGLYCDTIDRKSGDQENWESWCDYIRQFFRESKEARRLFLEARSQEIYPRKFRDFINQEITSIETKQSKAAAQKA